MNREQFTSLPLSAALALLFDAVPALAHTEASRVAQSPKYDGRCRTKGGLVYMSECDAGQLRYYLDRASKPSEERYRERNEKEAKALRFFLAWREANPDAEWVGERFNAGRVKALPPSSRPRVSDWDDSGPAQQSAEVSHGGGGEYGPREDDDDIPFAANVTCEPGERWWRR